MKKKILGLVALILFVLPTVGCWTSPEQGTVEVQTIYGQVKQVVRPPGIWTITTWGDDYWPVNVKSQTPDDYWVKSSTNDNAGFKWSVGISFSLPNNDDTITKHVSKFGVDESAREALLSKQIQNQLQSEINLNANNYDAYKLLANQELVQKAMFDNLKVYFKDQLFLELESLQLKGKPDFDNDAIDVAGSNVVANQKAKEAEEAGLAADRVKQERQKIQAENLTNPALFKIKILELQTELEKAKAEGIAKHQGNLTLIYGATDAVKLNLNQ